MSDELKDRATMYCNHPTASKPAKRLIHRLLAEIERLDAARKAAQWMQHDAAIIRDVRIGDDLLIEGVAALRAQRDAALAEVERLRGGAVPEAPADFAVPFQTFCPEEGGRHYRADLGWLYVDLDVGIPDQPDEFFIRLRRAPPAPAVPDDVAKDAARFAWLTEDHADLASREAVREICRSIPTRSLSGTRLDIDAAMLAAAPEVKP